MNRLVTLCGSTKFKNEFERMNMKLTLEGKIVLTVGFYEHHEGVELTDEQLELLKNLHFEKIKMSDEIFVINPNGYIGESTKLEIEYAKELGKQISFLE